jgi:hypothetical protein
MLFLDSSGYIQKHSAFVFFTWEFIQKTVPKKAAGSELFHGCNAAYLNKSMLFVFNS